MELSTVLHTRRSIRRFTDQPVDKALLNGLLEEAMWAPSGMNRQPWKFVVLEGDLFQRFLSLSSKAAEQVSESLQEQNFSEKMQTFVKGFFRNLGGAPLAVVCLSARMSSDVEDNANYLSAAAAFYNFLLLAHQAGLGCCWMTGHTSVEHELMSQLDEDESIFRLVGISPVGYPDQTPPIPPRKM